MQKSDLRGYSRALGSFLFSFLLVLSSCGYHFGRGSPLDNAVISVPYVDGDEKGYLTTALIRELSTKGSIRYQTCGGAFSLNVILFEPLDENIGFIYAPPEEADDFNRIVVSNEARLSLCAEVTLTDLTGKVVLGPFEVRSTLDFDFEPDLSNIGRHAFSLGQLEMHNLAEDAARRSLYNLLAEKIVDYVCSSW